jgi:hypothetical protein
VYGFGQTRNRRVCFLRFNIGFNGFVQSHTRIIFTHNRCQNKICSSFKDTPGDRKGCEMFANHPALARKALKIPLF